MADIPKAAIGSILRAICAGLSNTQQQLADRLGVSFTTANRWEGVSTAGQLASRPKGKSWAFRGSRRRGGLHSGRSRWAGQTEAVTPHPISDILADMQGLTETRELEHVLGEGAGPPAIQWALTFYGGSKAWEQRT